MNIRPTDPESSRRLSAPGAEAAPAQPARHTGPEATVTPATTPAATDRAELSSAARELFDQLTSQQAAAPTLAPERARAVLARLAAGHYDRAEVLDQVARRVQAAIIGTSAED